MEAFELILLLMVAVLLSSVLDQVVPRISSPLIQIGLGVIIALLAIAPIEVSVDPELFLILFIAPLLFHDSVEANKRSLWDNKGIIVSYAIGLVLLIVLCVGFVLHWLVPSIPLAAAFALGAALGPTDAVAVAALKREAQVGKRENAILQGEALINDASGVVSFQFAIAAAVTGFFSVTDAATMFAVNFFGGIILGIILALIFAFFARRVRELGLENITFHVFLEVSMPFIVFLIAEHMHVSGILGVVACGIVWSLMRDKRISPYHSRLNIALSSVWKVISFTLNGIVFVLLGIQLPNAMKSTWDDVYINNVDLICYVLILTVLIVGLRFLWALVMVRLFRNPLTGKRDKFNKKTVKNAFITTIGGPKGAITLSIVFSIPFLVSTGEAFPQRSLIIFLASGVIVCTLLLANFLLPVLAPKNEKEVDEEDVADYECTRIEILRTVIERLMADSTDEDDRETKQVIKSYNQRIRAIRTMSNTLEDAPLSPTLRFEVIDYQAERLFDAAKQKELEPYAVYHVIDSLSRQKNIIAHNKGPSLVAKYSLGRLRSLISLIKHNILSSLPFSRAEDKAAIDKARVYSEKYAVEFLRSLVDNPDYPSDEVARLLIRHERALNVLAESTDATVTSEAVENAMVSTNNIQRRGLQLELEVIQDFYASGDLTRAQAKELRDNTMLMLMDVEDQV